MEAKDPLQLWGQTQHTRWAFLGPRASVSPFGNYGYPPPLLLLDPCDLGGLGRSKSSAMEVVQEAAHRCVRRDLEHACGEGCQDRLGTG